MGLWRGITIVLICALCSIVSGALITSNWNEGAVGSSPEYPATFSFEQPFHLLSLETYHWNNGQGVATPGTMILMDESGKEYGPWQAVGSDGSGGVANAIWTASPDEFFPAGTYTVYDSDPDTCSTNAESGYTGFTRFSYEIMEEKVDPAPSSQDLEPAPDTGGDSSPQVIDYTFTSALTSDTQPVDRKTDFSTTDKEACFWVKCGPFNGGEQIEQVWIDPDGSEFYRSKTTVDDPKSFGYSSWIDHYAYSLIYIAGKKAEKKPGTWTVELYFDGRFMLSDTCTISGVTPLPPDTPDNGGTSGTTKADVSFLTKYAFILNANAKFDEADLVADQALELNPEDSDAHSMKGWTLTGLSRYEEALPYLDVVLKTYPDDSFALTNKAYCLIGLKRCGEAKSVIDHLKSLAISESDENIIQAMSSLCTSS